MEINKQPFNIEIVELDHWEERDRRNKFFELVYILEGCGMQTVNGTRSSYQKQSIFLLPASNSHSYFIEEPTKFLFIRFTANFFKDDVDGVIDFGKWFCRLNFIIGHYNRTAGDLIRNESDRRNASRLIELVIEESDKEDVHSRRITQSTMVSILEIIARNIVKSMNRQPAPNNGKFTDMLLHIQYYLIDQDMVSLKYLSAKFNVSETYFSEYFKRNSGEKFQDFILRSKLKLAEARAMYTDANFKEIAFELGFTDSSHMNRMMKKFCSRKLSNIRKESLSATNVNPIKLQEQVSGR
jgi:AraC family transcriptional regulator, transcriptional activator of pobA